MKSGTIKDADGVTIFPNVTITTTVWDRMRGLLGSSELQLGEGLLIKPCNMIHTAFMKVSIDVIFLDKVGTVLAIYKNLKPWKVAMCVKAKMVLELRSGEISELKTGEPKQLLWHPNV